MRVRWSRGARRQLLEILERIAEDDPRTARRWMERIRASVAPLASHPWSGRMVPEFGEEAIRERIVKPYRVLYTVADNVYVLGIYHSRQALPEDVPEEG